MFSNSSNRKQLHLQPNIFTHQATSPNYHQPYFLRGIRGSNGKENLLSPEKIAGASTSATKQSRQGSVHKLFDQARKTNFHETFLSIIKSPPQSKCKEEGSTNRRIILSHEATLPSPRKCQNLQVVKSIDIKIDPKNSQKESNSFSLSDIIYQFSGKRLSNVDLSCIQENREDIKQFESMFNNSDSFFDKILTSDRAGQQTDL